MDLNTLLRNRPTKDVDFICRLCTLLKEPDVVKISHAGQKAVFIHDRFQIPPYILEEFVCCKSMFNRWKNKEKNPDGTRGNPEKMGAPCKVPSEIMDVVWKNLEERTQKGLPRSCADLNRVLNEELEKKNLPKVSASYMHQAVKRNPMLIAEREDRMAKERFKASTFRNVLPMYADLHHILGTCCNLYHPKLVWNSDETMLKMSECSDRSKVVTYVQVEHRNNSVISGPKNATLTMLFTVCPDGTSITPVAFTNSQSRPEEYEEVLC
jgi:hypothetical protein